MTFPWLTFHAASLPRVIPRTEYAHGVIYAIAAGVAFGTLGPVSNLAYGAGMSPSWWPSTSATR